jgi:hypothetical protein
MKKRRDITLGEMQDECKRFTDGLCGGKSCAYQDLCNQIVKSGCTPHAWDLTDSPRFNETQMALLKGLYANGVMKLRSDCAITSLFMEDHEYIGNLINSQIGIELSDGETIDLAELLGKESNEK